MNIIYLALTCACFFIISCQESKRPTSGGENDDSGSTQKFISSKQVFRCDYSPLVDPNAKVIAESLNNLKWRVAADGVCNDAEVYDTLTKAITNLPDFTKQDYPFVGFCEHYLLTDGSAKALLIGFICENYGIVVWEMEADEDGRWMKTETGTLRGSEQDKASIQTILSKTKFDPL